MLTCCWLDIWEQMSVKCPTKYKKFHTRKSTWNTVSKMAAIFLGPEFVKWKSESKQNHKHKPVLYKHWQYPSMCSVVNLSSVYILSKNNDANFSLPVFIRAIRVILSVLCIVCPITHTPRYIKLCSYWLYLHVLDHILRGLIAGGSHLNFGEFVRWQTTATREHYPQILGNTENIAAATPHVVTDVHSTKMFYQEWIYHQNFIPTAINNTADISVM